MRCIVKRSDWRVIDYHPVYQGKVPPKGGVYLIVKTERVLGVPMGMVLLYVGKSRNLRRRFSEHTDPLREHNRALNDQSSSNGLEFWFTVLPPSQLNEAERRAIRALLPTTNIVRYEGATKNANA
jgi:excinuclease UvrABC nuclease subunit